MRQYIRFNTTEDIENFVKIMGKYNYEAELKSGRFCVDAKSFLGILSVGLQKTIILNVFGHDNELAKEIAPFAVEAQTA